MLLPSFSLTSAEVGFYTGGSMKEKDNNCTADESSSVPWVPLVMFAAPASLGTVTRPPWNLSSLDPLGGVVSLLLC